MYKNTKILLGLMLVLFVSLGLAQSPIFKAHFMTPEGDPWPFDVIISDGNWVQRFDSVTYIETTVPDTFTFTYVWNWPPYHTMNQVPLTFAPGEVREFEVYAINRTTVQPRVRPYIFFKEVNANETLSWGWDSLANTLNWSVSMDSGKIVDLGVWIDDALLTYPNYVLATCLSSEQSWGVCFPPNAFWDFSTGGMAAMAAGQLEFQEVESTMGLVGFRRALYNYAKVDTFKIRFESRLRDIDGVTYEPEFTYPQYSVPEGYYTLSPLGFPEPYLALSLPLKVVRDKPRIIDVYPPKMTELSPFTFSVAGEYFYANSSYSNLFLAPGDSITVDVSTETEYDWWGCFVLPESLTVDALLAYDSLGGSRNLHYGLDYLVQPVANYYIMVIRIQPFDRRLCLKYTQVEQWLQKESMPAAYDVKPGKYVKDGGSLVAVGTDLYAFHGNKSKAFYKYTDDAWTQLESIPFGVKPTDPLKINKKKIGKGASLCYDGDSIIYATKGNGTKEFWAYNIALDTWIQKSFVPVPKALKGGTQMNYYDGKICLLAGGQKKIDPNFYVFDESSSTWDTASHRIPLINDKPYKEGTLMTLCELENPSIPSFHEIVDVILNVKKQYCYITIHVHRPWYLWCQVVQGHPIPLPSTFYGLRKWSDTKDGAAIASSGDKAFFCVGGGKKEFWLLTPELQMDTTITFTLTPLETIPRLHKKSVPKTGAALAYASGTVWLLKGNNTPEFWCYTPSPLLLTGAKASTITSAVAKKNFIAIEPKLEAVPNPAYKFVTINYTLPLASKISLKLYNISGQLVQTLKDGHVEAGTYTMKLSTDNIAKGVYFLKYECAANQLQIKLIVQ